MSDSFSTNTALWLDERCPEPLSLRAPHLALIASLEIMFLPPPPLHAATTLHLTTHALFSRCPAPHLVRFRFRVMIPIPGRGRVSLAWLIPNEHVVGRAVGVRGQTSRTPSFSGERVISCRRPPEPHTPTFLLSQSRETLAFETMSQPIQIKNERRTSVSISDVPHR